MERDHHWTITDQSLSDNSEMRVSATGVQETVRNYNYSNTACVLIFKTAHIS